LTAAVITYFYTGLYIINCCVISLDVFREYLYILYIKRERERDHVIVKTKKLPHPLTPITIKLKSIYILHVCEFGTRVGLVIARVTPEGCGEHCRDSGEENRNSTRRTLPAEFPVCSRKHSTAVQSVLVLRI
jgi:hypothetical protein